MISAARRTLKSDAPQLMPPLVDGHSLRIPASAHTWSGFRAWAHSAQFPQFGRICFIDKEIWIDMSPEEIETHGKVKDAVAHGVNTFNDEADVGEFFPDGTMLSNREANLATVPDGSFVLWATSEAGKVRFIPRKDTFGEFVEIQGTPDWVLEVVSQFSIDKDTVELLEKYHRAGIAEYWLVNCRGQDIDFQILQWKPAKYVAVKAERGWHYSPVFDRRFRLVRRRNRAGRWNYKLENKRA